MPSCHARPQFTLPLVLFQELSSDKDTHLQSAHRKTDTLPDASRVEGLPSLCSLPKVVGPCRALIPRFYFNSTQLECLPFAYGGCDGNDNNFETYSDCQASCR
nr:conotoxin precursor conkunitzin [Conus judaeus]